MVFFAGISSEVWRDWRSGLLCQVDHLLPVRLGGGHRLLGVPHGLHAGVVRPERKRHIILFKVGTKKCGEMGGVSFQKCSCWENEQVLVKVVNGVLN